MTVIASDKPSALGAAIDTSVVPWWRDAGLRKLIFWQSWILVSQMIVGYDEVIVGTFQAMAPWREGTLRRALAGHAYVSF